MTSEAIYKQAKLIENAIESRRSMGWTNDPKWVQLVAVRSSLETAYQLAKLNELLAVRGVTLTIPEPAQGRKFRDK